METTNIIDFALRDGMTDALTKLLRTGAQELIATAIEAKLASYLAKFADVPRIQVTRPSCAMSITQSNHSQPALAL